ncbi:GSCOCG00006218001-RA-CDS [Cotesia congregata]|nr:GSCOCG00006218001-RA-CDS [Cotesia congregata]
MATKFLVTLGSILAVAQAGIIAGPPVPVVKASTDYDPHPQYTYAYDVQDSLTGDSKSQHETRNGDVVSGSYSLIEADGTRRVVEYTADPINGFNAVVHREPAVVNAVPAAPPVVAPAVVKTAPAVPVAPAVPAVPSPFSPYSPFSSLGPIAHAPAPFPYGRSFFGPAPVPAPIPAPVYPFRF